MPKVKCEICGTKTNRKGDQKRLFMAQFPLDVHRCRQWVRATGNEDLAYVPIEKLHQLKYICGEHFRPEDFKNKKTQLKKSAMPCIRITAQPLSEEILKDFPLHTAKEQDALQSISNEPSTSSQEPAHIQVKAKRLSSTGCLVTAPVNLRERSIGPCNRGHTYFKNFHNDHSYTKKVSILLKPDTLSREADTEEPSAIDDDVESSPPSPRGASYLPGRAPPSPLRNKEGEGARTLFSWQKSELIPADDIEEPLTVAELEEQSGVSLYCDENPAPPPAPQVPAPSVKEVEYRCKDCGEIIDGFQFWCVQCLGCALCGACEARGEHNRHYVLRAPPHRPYRQTQVVLATIRHQLQNENLLTQLGPDDGVKLEVKEEPPEECRVPAPDPLADDPLRHTPAPHTPPHTAHTSHTTRAQHATRASHAPHAHKTIKKYTALQPCKRPRLADFIEQDFTVEATQPQVKLTHERTPQDHILISFDDIPDQLEFFEEEAERIEETESEADVTGDDEYTEIGHLDDTDSDDSIHEDAVSTDFRIAEDAVSVNSRIDDVAVSVNSRIEESEVVTSVVVETDGVDTIASRSILKDIITSRKRRVDDTRQLPMRGSPKSMIRTLSSEAVVELKTLSSLQIRKWTADIKKRRK